MATSSIGTLSTSLDISPSLDTQKPAAGGGGAGKSTLRRMSQSPQVSRPVVGGVGGSRPPAISGGRPAAAVEEEAANPATLDYINGLRSAVRGLYPSPFESS